MSRFPSISAHAQHPAYGVLRKVTDTASVMLADNPSIMTLDGTNTWILRAPDSVSCVVVDPGPLDEAHLTRVAACGPVATVLITHGHADHEAGAQRFAQMVNAPIRANDPALCRNGAPLTADTLISAAGLRLEVLATPGHTADSICLLLDHEDTTTVLTGDTILGRGTTVVAHPDGKLADYLTSLRLLADLPPGTQALPGHGPELPDVTHIAKAYLTHREQRLSQVRAAVEQLGGSPTARQVVEVVYADVDHVLWEAAEWSVGAQLEYLRTEG
ncbi:MBL fold metallo-hydrolase [Umezawaea sp. Da 62-37]|uniref:MBL fold metallo-hydrolase n=1 Tax=Umezawaea sp. Da 62-37 TaxID=3075927 RepID=UPI0028F72C06|nr:MBL fold metallo-hydrolase [Umezawaea sp. Da 62-37]WNV91697.1 MBL fold metallo-hydrolase [Umezawaea sp. Da 62-37]